jgi:F-box and WD-40 domain protein CDC4
LRNIKFELGGKTVVFNEPEDAIVAIKEVWQSQIRSFGA